MGEMALRIDRRRKDLAASFNKLKLMVDDIKSARKSLAAHHRLVAEFVSASLLSAVPSPSPRDYASDLKLDDLQEGEARQEAGVRSPNGQICYFQDVGTMLQAPIVINTALPVKILSPELSAPVVLASCRLPAPPSVGHGSRSALSCENPEETDSVRNKASTSFCSRITLGSILWASLLFIFLCFFLLMGKQVAIGITLAAYSVLWLAFKGLLFVKTIPGFLRFQKFDPQARGSRRTTRSSTPRKNLLLSSAESHSCKGSHSLPMPNGCPQRKGYTNECDLATKNKPLSDAGTHFSRLKLGIMLVLALCGLAYGQIIAVCMCSSCALVVSQMQRLSSKRCRQGR